MEAIREALANYGNTWSNEVPHALAKLYGPVQAKTSKKYQGKIKAETAIKYGPDPRNRVDVYKPVEADNTSAGSGRPVVVFIHGGGLVAGDNNLYANIGNYFTSNGFVTCLVTYRLALQGGHHPMEPKMSPPPSDGFKQQSPSTEETQIR